MSTHGDKSMPVNDQSLLSSALERSVWSNKFSLASNHIVDKKLNKRLQKLINNKTLCYGTKVKKFGEKLKDKKYCDYQSKLLTSYLRNPEEHLKLDCDRLVLTFDCTSKDIKQISDIGRIKKFSVNATSKFISAKKHSVGQVNAGKKGPQRPFYTNAFRFELYGDSRRFFMLHVASGEQHKNEKTAFRVDFIPNRFSDTEIQLLFGHLKYLLGNRRYKQLINKATVTRVDVGFNMPGVLSSFVYPIENTHHEITETCLPDEIPKSLIETTYIGNRFESNHFIIYEKLLKEFKTEVDDNDITEKCLDDLLLTLAVTTRVEKRYYSHRSKKVLLSKLSKSSTKLYTLKFLNPSVVHQLSKKSISSLLRDKRMANVKAAKNKLLKEKVINKLAPCRNLSLNQKWFSQENTIMLEHYQSLISSPALISSSEINTIANAYDAIPKIQPKKNKIKPPLAEQDGALSKEQLNAIKSNAKQTLVLAGAGTGKTRTLIERIKYMVNIFDYNPEKITVLAYTNQAAQEIQQRVKPNIKSAKGLHVSTFSSWCSTTLKGLLKENYGTYSINEAVTMNELGQLCKKHKLKGNNVVKVVKNCLSYHVNRTVSIAKAYEAVCTNVEFTLEQLELVFKDYSKYKINPEQEVDTQFWDYDDLLFIMFKELKNNENFLKKVVNENKYLVLDEMQDSNSIQWRIIKKLTSNGCHLFCVGDPSQSIYGFRGSDYSYLDKFNKKFKDTKVFPLIDNYRTSPELLNLTNFVRHQINSKYPPLISKNESTCIPVLAELLDLTAVSKFIAKEIKTKLKEGIPINEIKVLARTKKQLTTVKKQINAYYSSRLKEADKFTHRMFDKLTMTMHAAKGTECDVCFVIDPRFEQYHYDSKDEHLRLHYVALTRAKKELYICKSMHGDSIFSDTNTGGSHILDLIAKTTLVELKFE